MECFTTYTFVKIHILITLHNIDIRFQWDQSYIVPIPLKCSGIGIIKLYKMCSVYFYLWYYTYSVLLSRVLATEQGLGSFEVDYGPASQMV